VSAVAQAVKTAPVLTLAEALGRARELVPRLRARAAEADDRRRIPEETVRELQESGLMRLLQPRRVGGSECEWMAMVDVSSELARGCGSTGWNWANWAVHHWMLALWPRQCQDEVWGPDPSALIASALMFPAGKATRVPGGYRLTGRWPFASGVEQSEWTQAGGVVEERAGSDRTSGGGPEMRLFMVPRSDYRILDTWHALGLRATGSHDIEAKDIFVPEHRTVSLDEIKGGAHPGESSNPGVIFRIPCFAALPQMLIGIPLGIAQGACDAFVEGLRARVSRYSGRSLADMTSLQMKVAEAGACVDAARRTLRAGCAQAQEIAERREAPDLVTKVTWRRDGAFAAQLCARAMDAIYKTAGATGLYDDQPLQRAFRDLTAANQHISMMWDAQATTYGRVALGLPCDNPTL
jgi:3-hydroxy-9,10-secoandrosta-1,3,5(10)-triene-9,17-dione monooxygenase